MNSYTHALAPLALAALLTTQLSGCGGDNKTIENNLGQAPTLSSGACSIIHCSVTQSDAVPFAGPSIASKTLSPDEIDHLWSSPIAGGILDHVYPGGAPVGSGLEP